MQMCRVKVLCVHQVAIVLLVIYVQENVLQQNNSVPIKCYNKMTFCDRHFVTGFSFLCVGLTLLSVWTAGRMDQSVLPSLPCDTAKEGTHSEVRFNFAIRNNC